MVKNSVVNQPTDMIRLGRHADSEQPNNSIVFNASESKIRDISHSGLYISPIRNAYASNLLAYDSITKEVVDIGGNTIKIDDLQVKNLDVMNMTTLNEEHVYTPILSIGEGCPENENVGVDIHGIRMIHDKSDGVLHVNKNTAFDGTVEASQFVGDGGLLSNVQYDLHVDIGDVVENLHVRDKLQADGGLLSNISVSQIKDFKDYSPVFTDLETKRDAIIGRNVYSKGRIHAKGSINSDNKVTASTFHGDGSHLEGVSKPHELKQLQSALSELSQDIERLSKIKVLTQEDINRAILEVNDENTKTTEDIKSSVTKTNDRVCAIEPRIKELDIHNAQIKTNETKLSVIQDTVSMLPDFELIQKNIADIQQVINTFGKHLDVKVNRTKINQAERDITSVNKKIEKILESVRLLDISLKTSVNHSYTIETKLNEYVPLTYIPGIELKIDEIKNAPLKGDGSMISNITLSNVLSCSNQSNTPLFIQNDITSKKLILTGEALPITSRLGEVKTLSMGDLAEINVYKKANCGTLSDNMGGIVFKTRGKEGKLNPNMTLDGNGKLALGTHKSHPSALLTLNSKTSGLLLPRMLNEEMHKINKPEPGLLVYDTDNDAVYVYKKSGWVEIK
tara:strand:- start:889 stop:2754 length:1866 start_codon:yes stop_codon:yes gene_type:complete